MLEKREIAREMINFLNSTGQYNSKMMRIVKIVQNKRKEIKVFKIFKF